MVSYRCAALYLKGSVLTWASCLEPRPKRVQRSMDILQPSCKSLSTGSIAPALTRMAQLTSAHHLEAGN